MMNTNTKVKVQGQLDAKILPCHTQVLVGTKWLNNCRYIMDVKAGDNFAYNGAWYTAESVAWCENIK